MATPTLRRLLRRPNHLAVREQIARRYLRGDGIEVGALNAPLRVPGCTVRYVDCVSLETVQHQYAERLDGIEKPDIICDLETLAAIGDRSIDFVIASHVLEHLENPLAALAAMARTLRAGGAAFIALPDKRYTFDKRRPVTPLWHIVRDLEEGPEWSRRGHYLDYGANVDRASDVEALADEYERIKQNIHFHVWDFPAMRTMFDYAAPKNGFRVAHAQQTRGEVVWVLRKEA